MAESEEPLSIAKRYLTFTENARTTHYDRADLNALLNRLVGGAAVISSAIVSTSVLANLNKDHPSFWLELAAGILAVVAAVFAGLQTFYRFGEIGERHRLAGAHFGEVHRELELLPSCTNEAEHCARLKRLLDKVGKLEEAGPGYPASVFRRLARRRQRSWRFWRPRSEKTAIAGTEDA